MSLSETVTPEFDTIMCLSTTKWIHLNFGDEGLKRVFRRIYAQLRPGGTFILESQAFSTYRKKKKLTEQILHNFKNIKLKPENFPDFLIHEVRFALFQKGSLISTLTVKLVLILFFEGWFLKV